MSRYLPNLSRGRLGGRLNFLAVWRRIRGPEMPPASRAHPELIWFPRHPWLRIAHFHFRAASLTPDVQINVGHSGDSTLYPCSILQFCRSAVP